MRQPVEIVEVDTVQIACDGGNGPLGHPRVYLTIERAGQIDCPYCGRRYVLKEGAKVSH
tara:strand:- start:241 stop:417 length:177 start_codon:yes stop_codon:yes gene_type:complete